MNTKRNQATVQFIGDDEELVKGLKAGQIEAKEALYERYFSHVKRVIIRTLGTNSEVQDHIHAVFIEAFCSAKNIKDGSKLKGWITRVAVYTAIGHIRKVSKKRWLVFKEPEQLPEVEVAPTNGQDRQAVNQVYEILDKMNEKERIPFALRVIEGMSLNEVADACDVSLATIKRRITKGRQKFEYLAKGYPLLSSMMGEE